MLDYYSLLSISKESSTEEVRSAYKSMIKKWHPDTFRGDTTLAELMTRQLNEAYEVLIDAQKRRKYDFSLEKSIKEREKWINYAKNPDKSNVNTETTVKGPAFDDKEETAKKNKIKKEKERIDKWMTIVSKYMADHGWAGNVFENLSEKMRLKVLAGNLTLKDAFVIYCTLQQQKSNLGLSTSYFNAKKIQKILESAKTEEDIEVAFQLISRQEIIMQIFLKARSGMYSKKKLTEGEINTIYKFVKFHNFLSKRPDDFFIGISHLSVTKTEWENARELVKMEV